MRKILDSIEKAWLNWTVCLVGNDVNSIFQQITQMIWDAGIYRIILKSRNIAIQRNPDQPKINHALHLFIDRNFFQTQSMQIRRIVEASYNITGAKGVFSIGAILKDIKQHRLELTRQKYMELRNLTYDYSLIIQEREEFFRSQKTNNAFFVPKQYDWESIEEAHQTFDLLSRKKKEDRKLDDVIDRLVLESFSYKLSECKDISIYVDKFVAHSATPESRSYYDENDYTITLGKIWKANEIIFKVANFLSELLFCQSHMALAIENPSFYDNWEVPIFHEKDLDTVRSTLESFRRETGEWLQQGHKAFLEFIK